MAEKSKWVITTSGKRPVGDVKKDLVKAGLKISEELHEIGVIIGVSDEAVAKKVRALDGVADVAKEGRVDIGPPGSKKTW